MNRQTAPDRIRIRQPDQNKVGENISNNCARTVEGKIQSVFMFRPVLKPDGSDCQAGAKK